MLIYVLTDDLEKIMSQLVVAEHSPMCGVMMVKGLR